MSSAPTATLSTKNCTPATPDSSFAFAVTLTMSVTCALAAGELIVTVGGVPIVGQSARDGRRHVVLDLGLREGCVVDADLVDETGVVLAVERIAPDRERGRRGGDRTCRRRRAGEGTVDVEANVGAVVREREMRPPADREDGRPVTVGVAAADDRSAVRCAAGVGCGLQVVVVVALLDHVAPARGDLRGVDPGFERHRGAEVQGGGVGDRDAGATAVEAERLPVLARARPGGVGSRARVAGSRGVRDRRPRTLVERIRRDRRGTRGRRGGRGGGDVAVRTEVGGGVGGADAVAVACGAADARVAVGRAGSGRRGDLREIRAGGALAALDEVAGDGDVIGGCAPGEVDTAARDRGGRERSGRRGRLRVGSGRRGRGGDVAVRADVRRGVGGADPVPVGRARRNPRVAVSGRGSSGRRDLGEVRAGGTLAALDLVARDGDVVGGCDPGEVDPTARERGRRERARRGGRLRVGWASRRRRCCRRRRGCRPHRRLERDSYSSSR